MLHIWKVIWRRWKWLKRETVSTSPSMCLVSLFSKTYMFLLGIVWPSLYIYILYFVHHQIKLPPTRRRFTCRACCWHFSLYFMCIQFSIACLRLVGVVVVVVVAQLLIVQKYVLNVQNELVLSSFLFCLVFLFPDKHNTTTTTKLRRRD